MATRNRGDPRGSGFGSVFIDSTVARAHQHAAGALINAPGAAAVIPPRSNALLDRAERNCEFSMP